MLLIIEILQISSDLCFQLLYVSLTTLITAGQQAQRNDWSLDTCFSMSCIFGVDIIGTGVSRTTTTTTQSKT
jgi:hypothetical protein